MSEARQRAEKDRWLKGLLRGIVPEERIRPCIPSPKSFHYRSRVQFQIGRNGEVGFFAFHSQRVVGIDRCLITREEINRRIPDIAKQAREILASPRRPTLLHFEATLEDAGRVTIRTQDEERSFVQVNAEANQLLQDFLREQIALSRPAKVLELYAGDGNLSTALADLTQEWVALEANPFAVNRAKLRGASSQIQWVQGEVGQEVRRLSKKNAAFDLVLLDPPREGAGKILPELFSLKPREIHYVSCNPLTLSEDLKALVRGGYQVAALQPFDFFPQTMNLETVALCRLD